MKQHRRTLRALITAGFLAGALITPLAAPNRVEAAQAGSFAFGEWDDSCCLMVWDGVNTPTYSHYNIGVWVVPDPTPPLYRVWVNANAPGTTYYCEGSETVVLSSPLFSGDYSFNGIDSATLTALPLRLLCANGAIMEAAFPMTIRWTGREPAQASTTTPWRGIHGLSRPQWASFDTTGPPCPEFFRYQTRTGLPEAWFYQPALINGSTDLCASPVTGGARLAVGVYPGSGRPQ